MTGIAFKTTQDELGESTLAPPPPPQGQAHALVSNLPIRDRFLGDETDYFWLLLDLKHLKQTSLEWSWLLKSKYLTIKILFN